MEDFTKKFLDASKARTEDKGNAGPSTSKVDPPVNTDAGPSEEIYEHQHLDEIEDDTETKGRLEWGVQKTKRFLAVYQENKDAMKTTRNRKKVWEKIATDVMAANKTTIKITGDQARDRFYTLKRSYRKFLSESNKTGNKTPKPFLFEKEMQDILHDDPTFKPECAIGSLRSDKNHTDEENSDDNAGPPQKKKKTANKTGELKSFLLEREERMLKALQDMQASQNNLLEKILEKL